MWCKISVELTFAKCFLSFSLSWHARRACARGNCEPRRSTLAIMFNGHIYTYIYVYMYMYIIMFVHIHIYLYIYVYIDVLVRAAIACEGTQRSL